MYVSIIIIEFAIILYLVLKNLRNKKADYLCTIYIDKKEESVYLGLRDEQALKELSKLEYTNVNIKTF